MALLKIRTFGDPVLRERAREVERVTDLHRRLIADMFDTMRNAPGVGLAAPQVGVMERIFVYESDENRGALINPEIVARSETIEEGEEGCLSLPGIAYPVPRPATVTIKGTDEHGEVQEIEATELLARIFQHESDHLDGVLFIDHLDEATRREALSQLRNQALGLPSDGHEPSREETL